MRNYKKNQYDLRYQEICFLLILVDWSWLFLRATVQRLIEQEQVTVTEQANWQSFLRERGWKCKALQSQVERLCILPTSIHLLGEKPVVELRWRRVCRRSATPRKFFDSFIATILTFKICIIRRAEINSVVQCFPLKERLLPRVTWKVQLKARLAGMCYTSGGVWEWGQSMKKLLVRRRRGERLCAYSRVKGPTWRGALSLGEEQELVVNEEEDGEEE